MVEWILRLLFSLYSAPEALWYLPLLLEYVAVISIGLAVFNIIPISPLDGSKVLLAFLPTRVYMKLERYEHYGMFVLMAVAAARYPDGPLQSLRDMVYGLLNFASIWPARWLAILLDRGMKWKSQSIICRALSNPGSRWRILTGRWMSFCCF